MSFSLMLLFFCCQRRVQIEHSFGQLHVYLLVLEVYAFQIRLCVRNLMTLAARAHNQQRRFTGAKLNTFNLAKLAIRVKNYAAD